MNNLLKKMRQKILLLIIMIVMMIFSINVFSFATDLKIMTISDKVSYNLGEKVKITVKWDKGMQGAIFVLNYDPAKLKFENASISNTFYNSENLGKISVNWATFNEKDCTDMDFNFISISEGKTVIYVDEPKFADSNIKIPDNYIYNDTGKIEINILKNEDIKMDIDEETNDNEQIKNENNNYNEEIAEIQNSIISTQKQTSKKSPEILPKTGINFKIYIMFVFNIIIIICLFIKNKQLRGI